MFRSFFYIVIVFAMIFHCSILNAQDLSIKDPTISDGLVSAEEIQKYVESFKPQVVRSYLEKPVGFGENITTQMSTIDSRGTEFWLLFKRNNDAENVDLFLDITSEEDVSGTVTISGIGFSTNFTVLANTVTRVNIPANAMIMPSGVVQDLGIHVEADKDVTVYGMNRKGSSTDGFLGLPVDILGTQHLIVTYPMLQTGFNPSEDYAPQFAIVSPYDNNVVTIIPKDQTFNGHPAGVPFSVTLNKGQTYLIRGRMSNSYNADQTGSVISSTLPVAVFSGSSCACVPQNVPACDHLVEQIPPISTWGSTFVTKPLESRKNGDLWRFLSSQNGTQLFIDGTLVATLNFADFYETILTTSSFVESTNPILAVQFSMSQNFDGVVADPFIMIIPPYQQYLPGYSFSTPSSGFSRNYFTSAVDSDGVSGMKLNGAPLNPASFSAIGATGFSAGAFPIDINSSYTISNSGNYPSGLYVYGFGSYDSYGFPGGLSLLSINPGSGPSIELTSATIGLFCNSISSAVEIEISAYITDPAEPFVQNAVLFYRKIGDITFSSLAMEEGEDDEWSVTLHAELTEFPGLEFYIFATDGQISTTSPSIDPENYPYSIGIDNLPPEIDHVPISNAIVGENIDISAAVVDDTESVSEVLLLYRIIGGTPLYTKLIMNDLGSDIYAATIPGSQMTDQGIEYYIRGTDNHGVSCTYGSADMPLVIVANESENIPPVPVGFPGLAPTILVGDTYVLNVQFESPELDQTTDVVVNDGGLTGFTATVTPGNIAEVEIELVGQSDNIGTHYIEFIATDDGVPSKSTTVIFQISVIDPLAGHIICIPEGWSGISSYNDPFNPSMEDIFANLVTDEKVEIVLGDNGFYWPAQNINTMTSGWDIKKGYKIKMNEPGCIGIQGNMPDDKSIEVKKGASFIPVLCDYPVAAADIFSQLDNNMLVAFDIHNQLVYWPMGGLFTLEALEPGIGYLVSMLNNSSANFECGHSMVENYIKAQPPTYKNAPWTSDNTGNIHLISINSTALSTIQSGDYIGVFNSEGICSGFTQFNGKLENILLVAYGANPQTGQKGLAEGEQMSFRIYRNNSEIRTSVVFDPSMPNAGSYVELGQSKINAFKADATSVQDSKLSETQLHPNPNNGIFNIDLPIIDGTVTIQILNAAGQVVLSKNTSGKTSRYQLDLSLVRQGVYFVKISGNNESIVKKVVIQ